MNVGNNTYTGDSVADGFFHSLSSLKSVDIDLLNSDSAFQQFSIDYSYVKDICEKGTKIPPITLSKASKILHKMKGSVNDFFSITALHFINGGPEALDHYCFILNAIISDISNASSPELNTVFAHILYL